MSEQIDWTKPVRWIGGTIPTKVIKVNEDGSAWVVGGLDRAHLICADGWHQGGRRVENIPQPTVLWLIVHNAEHEAYEVRDFKTNFIGDPPAQYRLEISPDGKTITGERVE